MFLQCCLWGKQICSWCQSGHRWGAIVNFAISEENNYRPFYCSWVLKHTWEFWTLLWGIVLKMALNQLPLKGDHFLASAARGEQQKWWKCGLISSLQTLPLAFPFVLCDRPQVLKVRGVLCASHREGGICTAGVTAAGCLAPGFLFNGAERLQCGCGLKKRIVKRQSSLPFGLPILALQVTKFAQFRFLNIHKVLMWWSLEAFKRCVNVVLGDIV